MQRTICIKILGFKYLDSQEYHNVYRLKEVKINEELADLIEIYFIELPKFKEDVKSPGEIEKVDALAKGIELLREPESNVVRKLELEDKAIKKSKDYWIYVNKVDTFFRTIKQFFSCLPFTFIWGQIINR